MSESDNLVRSHAGVRVSLSSMRVLAYWLLYAVVGLLVIAMAMGGGGDLGSEDSSSPIRRRTKMIGAASGLALGVALLGAYLLSDAAARPTIPTLLLAIGGPAAVVLTIWSWVAIARDLRGRARFG
jgi:hypothetical protein